MAVENEITADKGGSENCPTEGGGGAQQIAEAFSIHLTSQPSPRHSKQCRWAAPHLIWACLCEYYVRQCGFAHKPYEHAQHLFQVFLAPDGVFPDAARRQARIVLVTKCVWTYTAVDKRRRVLRDELQFEWSLGRGSTELGHWKKKREGRRGKKER